MSDPGSLQRLKRLAWLLDSSIRIPGTGWRFGLDPILGLIPLLGDAVGTAFSGYIVVEAARLGVARTTLLRMFGNLLLESVIGVIPLAGDLFDATWKANLRNIELLERHIETPTIAKRKDRAFVILLATGVAGTMAGLLAGLALLIRWLFF